MHEKSGASSMKPGDLVRYKWSYYQDFIGIVVEIKNEELLANPIVVLIKGQLHQFNSHELELVNDA